MGSANDLSLQMHHEVGIVVAIGLETGNQEVE